LFKISFNLFILESFDLEQNVSCSDILFKSLFSLVVLDSGSERIGLGSTVCSELN